METTINDIIRAINQLSYDFKEDDKIKIRVKHLLMLKREIESLNTEIDKLKLQLKIEKNENKRLTGKLIECQQEDVPNFEMYM